MKNSNREELNSIIHIQQNLMKILFGYIEKMVNSLDITNSIYLTNILSLLEKSKRSLELCNENMNLLNSLIKDFNNSSESFENNYSNTILIINSNTAFIEDYIYSILQFFELALPKETHSNKIKTITSEISDHKKIIISESIKNNENSLIISETSGNIILPYYISDLENTQNKTNEQVIQENYTIPIDLFKPAFVSRFREAFRLAHTKEKKSVAFSLNLATELMFNYNLHPAIITACKSLDELDIYLDCLENNEIEKFKCFNIIFEIPPIISKKP